MRTALFAVGAQPLTVQLLGPLEVFRDGRGVRLGSPKQQVLLALLALRSATFVSTAELIAGVWDDPPPSAPKMLQLYVCQLRRLLGADAIATRGRSYALCAGRDAVDACRFERLVGDAVRLPQPDAAGPARSALALWRSTPLADLHASRSIATQAQHLGDLRVRAHEIVNDALLRQGGHASVLAGIDALIESHPTRERLHAQRMLALYRDGRQVEAADGYQHARRLLADHYGIEPGRELRALQTAILRQDLSLDRAAPVGGPRDYAVPA